MMIGNTSLFAIESGITEAYDRPSLRALGFFLMHIGGNRFGVEAPKATMLACSFDEVQRRIIDRGRHVAPFATEIDAREIARAVSDAIYASNQDQKSFFGIPKKEFSEIIFSKRLLWAPDGDEAFDDGSYILHFDVDDRVRLIAFKRGENHHDLASPIRDMWLKADYFYEVLERWHASFEAEWRAAPKK